MSSGPHARQESFDHLSIPPRANAWGGDAGFIAHQNKPPTPFAYEAIEEVMTEFALSSGNSPSRKTSLGEPLGAECGYPERQRLQSWDLNVGGPSEVEAAPNPIVEGRRGN